jgi:hypothetical protein
VRKGRENALSFFEKKMGKRVGTLDRRTKVAYNKLNGYDHRILGQKGKFLT